LRWIARNRFAASPIEAIGISTGSSQVLATHATGFGSPGEISSRPWVALTSPSSARSSSMKPSGAR
jgi:hypothetical protein